MTISILVVEDNSVNAHQQFHTNPVASTDAAPIPLLKSAWVPDGGRHPIQSPMMFVTSEPFPHNSAASQKQRNDAVCWSSIKNSHELTEEYCSQIAVNSLRWA